ncbi:alpha/beta hydrolase [Streptomyces sp. NPDC048550]|uniref:alpha/beta fold hydrolase n=1 Tax=Streptomyces sp. NPDC048550 TaxID=3155739 RepID=UPI00342CDBB3
MRAHDGSANQQSPVRLACGPHPRLPDIAELIQKLELSDPILVGFDWGGRAACIAAALWPERVGGLVAIGGNEIQNITGFAEPADPRTESRSWYQYYFHGRTRTRRSDQVSPRTHRAAVGGMGTWTDR